MQLTRCLLSALASIHRPLERTARLRRATATRTLRTPRTLQAVLVPLHNNNNRLHPQYLHHVGQVRTATTTRNRVGEGAATTPIPRWLQLYPTPTSVVRQPRLRCTTLCLVQCCPITRSRRCSTQSSGVVQKRKSRRTTPTRNRPPSITPKHQGVGVLLVMSRWLLIAA